MKDEIKIWLGVVAVTAVLLVSVVSYSRINRNKNYEEVEILIENAKESLDAHDIKVAQEAVAELNTATPTLDKEINKLQEETGNLELSQEEKSEEVSELSTSVDSQDNNHQESNIGRVSNGIVTAIQTLARQEGYTGASFPWSHRDYNIREASGDNNYTASGTFTWEGQRVRFSVSATTTDGNNVRITSYSFR